MDNITTKTYQDNYQLYKEKTPNEVSGDFVRFMDLFLEQLPEGGSIFEIASAHGRDAMYFRDKGFSILCTDIIPDALVELAHDGFETRYVDVLEDIPDDIKDFDGVFANAVFHHFTPQQVKDIFISLINKLKPGAIFAFKVKEGSGEEMETGKLGGERYFKFWSQEEMNSLVEEVGWTIVDSGHSSDGKWVELVCKK